MSKRVFLPLLIICTGLFGINQQELIEICKVYGMSQERAKYFTAELITQCTLANFNPMIMFNLAIAESGLKNIKGDNGKAIGYFQLHKETVWFVKSYYKLEHIPKDFDSLLTRIDLQIEIAVLYMKYLLDRYGSLEKALEKWNGSAKYVTYYKNVCDYIERNFLKEN